MLCCMRLSCFGSQLSINHGIVTQNMDNSKKPYKRITVIYKVASSSISIFGRYIYDRQKSRAVECEFFYLLQRGAYIISRIIS